MTEYARLVLAVDSTSAKKATDDLRQLDAQSSKTEKSAGSLASAFKPLAAAFAGLKVGQLIQESTLLASRYDQLGLIMNVVGKNVGRSSASLDELQANLQKTGISAIQSRNNIIKMISANIDLSKATDLARLAQDAAAVAGTSSSEAFARLVRGIQSAEKETLETLGLNVNFQQSYERLADQLGKTAKELTTVEKTQAATNAALEAGRNIAGSYEASLDNAGKQLQSATRYLEDFQVKLGAAFQPAFAQGVTAYSQSLKFLSSNVEGVVQVLEAGLYVAIARGTTVIATNTGALIAQAIQQAKNNALAAESAAFEVRKTAAAKASALSDLEKARASEAAAIAALAHARANQQLFAIQVALSRGTAEYAALSRGLAVVDRELAASEQAVALATANRTAATAAAATASGALAKATTASTAANVAAAASSSLASRAMTGVTAVGGRLLGLLGGPLGLALSVGAVALSFVDFSDDAGDAKVAADALTGSVDRLGDAADRARARFAGLLGDVSNLNKAELQVRTNELESQLKGAERQLKSFERQFERGVGSQGQIDGAKAAIKTLRDELERLGKEQVDQGAASTKDGKRYVERLTEQRALLGAVTEQERIRAQIKAGLLKISPEEEKQVLALAAEVDAYEASTRAAEENARAGEQSAERRLRASEQLLDSYNSTAAALSREIALFGKVSGVAQLSYDLEKGDLSGLSALQKARLIDLQEELDAKKDLAEQDGVRLEILRATGQLKAANDAEFELDYAQKIAEYEKQGNVEALQRLETLRQIREIQASEVEPGTVEGVSKAPGSTGLDASVGGANSELERLQEEADEIEEWRAIELEKQRAFLEARAINSEEFAEREKNINAQTRDQLSKIETAKNQAILASSGEFFGQMAILSQSGNKKLGAVGKAAAIAQATISGFTAIQNALAVPPYPVGLALAVSAGVVTAANIASIAGVGFAQGGYTGPGGVNQPAGTVHKGEVVWSQADIRRAGGVDAVEAMRAGQNIVNNGVAVGQPAPGPMQSNQQVNNINVNVTGISEARGMRESAAKVARDVARAVQSAGRYN
ncbi:MAG TPA: hypothetical protein VFE95_05625 [Pseudomonas sp.]|nr:hypothetical protein [Pseudomonas sp.]